MNKVIETLRWDPIQENKRIDSCWMKRLNQVGASKGV